MIRTSRKYGKFLEIDPFVGLQKACTLNCLGCSLGESTQRLSYLKKEYNWPEPEQLLEQVSQFNDPVDRILVAGRGEPFLYPRLDELLKLIRSKMDVGFQANAKVTIATNGTMLSTQKNINLINRFDERFLNFDFFNQADWSEIGRPLSRVYFEQLLSWCRKTKGFHIVVRVRDWDLKLASQDDWFEILSLLKPLSITLQPYFKIEGKNQISEDTLDAVVFKINKRLGLKPILLLP